MRIAYSKVDGKATNIRFVADDYQASMADELVIQGDILPTAADLSDPPSLAEMRAAAIVKLDAAFEAAAAQLVAGYPPSERLTWRIQEDEADAWTANPVAPTPYVDQLAAARGIDRLVLLGKVMENVTLFRQASALLIGKRQKWRDTIEAAADQVGIDAAVAAGTADIAGALAV